jgi:O-antigen/teichoic acid export membrane protein
MGAMATEGVRSTPAARFRRDAAMVFVAMSVLNAANLLFHVFATRRLDIAGYGLLASVLALISIALLPASIAQVVVARFRAELRASASAAANVAFERIVVRWTAIVTVAVAVAGLLLSPLIAKLLDTRDLPLALLAVVTLTLAFPLPSLRGLAQGRESLLALSGSLVVEGVVKLGLAVALAGRSVSLWLVSLAIAYGAAAAGTLGALVRGWRDRSPYAGGLPDVREVLAATGGAAAALAVVTIPSYADTLATRAFFTPDAAGAYAAVALCGKIVLFLVGFAQIVVVPHAAAERSRGGNPLNVLRLAATLVLPLFAIVLAASFVWPERFISLIAGTKFVAAAPLIRPYGLAACALGITGMLLQYRIAVHRLGFIVPALLLVAGQCAVLLVVAARFSGLQVVETMLYGNLTVLAVVAAGVRPWTKPERTAAA